MYEVRSVEQKNLGSKCIKHENLADTKTTSFKRETES